MGDLIPFPNPNAEETVKLTAEEYQEYVEHFDRMMKSESFAEVKYCKSVIRSIIDKAKKRET